MGPTGVLLWLLITAVCNAQPSEFIITYDGLTAEELQTKCTLLNCSRVFSNVIQGIVVTKDPLAAQSLSVDDPSVQDMTPNSKVSLYQVQDATGASLSDIKVPYHLDRLDQLTLPLDGNFTRFNDCDDITIYVIDTGVYANHTEFLGADNRISRVRAGFAAGTIPDTIDKSGHGTFVASLAAGRTVGVCAGATIVPVAVLDAAGDGPISQIVEGLEWIVADAQSAKRNNSVIISKSDMGYPGMSSEAFQNANISLLACQLFVMLVSLAVSVGLATRKPRAAPLSVAQKL
jgi:serine protease